MNRVRGRVPGSGRDCDNSGGCGNGDGSQMGTERHVDVEEGD
jgi:hypothetical protein